MLLGWQAVSAQSLEERYRSFQKSAKKTYADFRAEANARYAEILGQPWEPQVYKYNYRNLGNTIPHILFGYL